MRTLAAIAVLSLLPVTNRVEGPAAPVEPAGGKQDEERVYLDEVPEEFQKRWAAAEGARDWKQLVDLHLLAQHSFPRLLCQPDPGVKRWVRVPRVLNARLASMPESAREPYEAVAREVLETLQDRHARRQAIEKYGFTCAAREALEALANQDFDQGRVREAIRGWTEALECRASPEVIARLANAHAALGDGPALSALLAQAETRGWKGEVRVAGKRRDLRDYLASLPSPPAAGARPAAAAALQKPTAVTRPTCEIPLGYYDLKNEGGVFGRGLSTGATGVPACARLAGVERVLLSNGLKLIALDPARAEGGPLEDAVEWRYPKEGNVRYYMPYAYSPPLPFVGATIEQNRAFVTMFSTLQRQGQVGRRPDRFDGPAAIRAFDVVTGELLWDTDTLSHETDAEGSKVLMIEKLPFGRQNFCFGGPPLARGERLYAAILTSPLAGRECHVLCLDATQGKTIWSTLVARAPQTRGATSVTAIAEEEGTVAVATNFGIAAALDSHTGAIEWLVKYAVSGSRMSVNPPILQRSRVYVLSQDSEELLVLDRWTGREGTLPVLSEEVSWSQVRYLAGKVGDWLIFSGAKSYAIRVTDGKVVDLSYVQSSPSGRGVIVGNLLYLPTRAALNVFDTTTWKLRDSVSWSSGDDAGNLVVTDSLCAFLSERLDLFTSRGALQERFAAKVEASPPRAEPCRQLGQILEGAGRPAEAVRYYRRALALWENDPAWRERAEELRKKLTHLAEKLGDEFPKD